MRILIVISSRAADSFLPRCADQSSEPGGIRHRLQWRVLVQLHQVASHASKAGTAYPAAPQSLQKGGRQGCESFSLKGMRRVDPKFAHG